MQYIGYGLSDRGRSRPVNEDVVVTDPSLGLWVVCDGMGGHAAGDLAARTAAQALCAYVAANRASLQGEGANQRDAAVALMRRATREASRAVFQLVASGQAPPGMGTTLTALLTRGRIGVMAHVGDSRLYLLRAGAVHQLSDDHTIAAELVRRGGMPQEMAQGLNVAKALSRAVGVQPTVEVDSLVFDVLPDDTFLLCSDGLTRYLTGMEELHRFLAALDPSQVPPQLVDLANQRGGRDNVSVVVVRAQVDSVTTAADHAHRTEVVLKLQTLRHVSLFQPLTLKELVQVMNRLTAQSYEPGERIIREGDPGDGLYVLLEGCVEVTRGGSELAVLGSGTHFGEMALLNERPRSATVTARDRTRLMKMSREAFNDLIRQHATLAVKLLWTFAQVLAARLDGASEHAFNLAPTQVMPDPVPPKVPVAPLGAATAPAAPDAGPPLPTSAGGKPRWAW
jgi:PPM family protein phosphatase